MLGAETGKLGLWRSRGNHIYVSFRIIFNHCSSMNSFQELIMMPSERRMCQSNSVRGIQSVVLLQLSQL